MTISVVACDGLDPEAVEIITQSHDVKLEVHSGIKATELLQKLGDADVAIIRSATQLTAVVLKELPKLKGVLRAGVGLDNIDVKAAEELGIMVWNAPQGNFQSTAELALAHIFNLARKLTFATEGAREGKWLKKEIGTGGRQLSGLKLGIYGAGNIGSKLASMATGIGMTVQICDPVYKEGSYKKVDFEELLKTSDVISIHAPLLPSTRGVFNLEAFKKAKYGLIIVNCARGGLINEADLVVALNENLVAGAGLDVFEKEPFDSRDATTKALLSHARVSITPHVGASTIEAQRLVGLECAEKILAIAKAVKGKTLSEFPPALSGAAKPRFLA
jgi:D-3-phosphoglycerate dehydrogenase